MQRQEAKSIGEIIAQYLKTSQLENRVFEGRLAEVWREALGNRFADQTERIHLEDGVLYVTLRSPSLAHDLMMQRTRMAECLNQRLGSTVVRLIVFR